MTRADTSVEIHDLIAERRSPRSLDAMATMGNQDLLAVLEAARCMKPAAQHKATVAIGDVGAGGLLTGKVTFIKRPVLVTDDGAVGVGFTDNGWKLRFGIRK